MNRTVRLLVIYSTMSGMILRIFLTMRFPIIVRVSVVTAWRFWAQLQLRHKGLESIEPCGDGFKAGGIRHPNMVIGVKGNPWNHCNMVC